METTRQQKVARLIQKDLSGIIQFSGREVTQGKMVTITVVRMSPDLSVAKVYLSIFPSGGANAFREHLQGYVKHLRLELGRKVRHQLRIVPELAFFIDDSMDYAEHIDTLLTPLQQTETTA
jgi:ribosome-binding factor A